MAAKRKPGAAASLPASYEPQLATLVTAPPGGDAWLHELKYDGYRIGCRIDGKHVALLSRRYSAEQVAAHFAAKQEIHARFTADQKIGNIWRWTWRGLALQPPVAKFLRESREQPERSTEQLALEFFGAIDARTVSTHASPEVLH